ncbi:amidohydrolase [Leucobacter ruminantium]|uniref:Amidohydrolase n=1 Tax=Leucobacter ruminantium TaxID=1289170 RepID=A0A939RWA6_9MICO|nr:amidohydrolase [Leucobacter ruminantium]MBO1804817.1 amidohydrolase [Leucobacter ruminantium]
MLVDTIIENARITTMDPKRPQASRLGIFAGRIIGFDEALDGISAEVRIDLDGAPVVPGFNDAHMHFSALGLRMDQLDLSAQEAPTLDALYKKVERYAATRPAGSWVIGHGYDQNRIGAHPDRDVLDRISGGRPVFILHNSAHMCVANTEAFALAGHPDPDALEAPVGGEIGRDDTGRNTGLLADKAMSLVDDYLRLVPQTMLFDALKRASRWCLRHGLTSVTEAGVSGRGIGNGPGDVRAYQDLLDAGKLHTRLTLMPYIDALHGLGPIGTPYGNGDGWGIDLGLRSGIGNEWLRLGPTKVLSDGSLIGHTAAMCHDYVGEPGNTGLMAWDEAELRDMLITAHVNGWQVAAHAIGDRAVGFVLDALDEAQKMRPRSDARHRLEHAAIVSDEQVERIADGGYIPVPQGRFISELGDGFVSALGPERMDQVYRMRSFVDRGVELPGSTDAPVVPAEPLISLHDMVNRRAEGGELIGPDERLTPWQALRAYTYGSAYAVHEERLKGSLSRGKLADLVVLSDDLLAVSPEKIKDIEVRATMVGGKFRYDAEQELAAP